MRRLLTLFAVDLATHFAEDVEEARRAHDARGRARWKQGRPLKDQDFNQIWDFVLFNQAGGKGEETVFGKPVGSGFVDRLRWAKTLRNKYEHSNAVEGPEQLADLLLLRQLVKQVRSRFNLHSECTGLIDEAIQAELPFYVSRTTELLGLEERLTELSESSEADRSGTVLPPVTAPSPAAAIEGDGAKAPISAADVTAVLADLRAVRDAVTASGRRNEYLVDLVLDLSHRLEAPASSASVSGEAPEADPWEALGGEDPDDLPFDAVDDQSLSEEEVRDRLIALRWRIWEELGVGPSPDGLLRKRMLEQLISQRVVGPSDWIARVSDADRDRTAAEQLAYLPEVFAIISRLDT